MYFFAELLKIRQCNHDKLNQSPPLCFLDFAINGTKTNIISSVGWRIDTYKRSALSITHGSFSQMEFVSILSCWTMIWLGAKAMESGNSWDVLVWMRLKDPLQGSEECELQFQWYQKQLILFFRSEDIKEVCGLLISSFNWGLGCNSFSSLSEW